MYACTYGFVLYIVKSSRVVYKVVSDLLGP
jgi:hypothetical protein